MMVLMKDLEDYATRFLQKYYQQQLTIPIERNNRLRSTLGRYVVSSKFEPLRIEIAGQVLTYGTEASILGILKHECIHYALHMQGDYLRDGEPEFEIELAKHGAPSTQSLKIGRYFVFRCRQCGSEGETRVLRVMKEPQKYRTVCCGAKLDVMGERIYNGNQRLD